MCIFNVNFHRNDPIKLDVFDNFFHKIDHWDKSLAFAYLFLSFQYPKVSYH
jgi:hypothetical protein